jgi:hypothetical protein
MSAAASENEMQMQSALLASHHFSATPMKTTQGKEEAPNFLLRRATVQHTSDLEYFGQSKVEDAAHGVKANVQKRVRFKEADGSETWPAQVVIREQKTTTNQQSEETKDCVQLPICGHKTIANQQPEGIEDHNMLRHRQHVRIDESSRFSTQHDDIAEGSELTPRSTLNDMHMMHSNLAPAGQTLPKTTSPASSMTPALQLPVTGDTPKIIRSVELNMADISPPDRMLTRNFLNDELDNGDATPLPGHIITFSFPTNE